jgi:hypothetical protein
VGNSEEHSTGCPRYKVRPTSEITKTERAGGVAQVAQHLPASPSLVLPKPERAEVNSRHTVSQKILLCKWGVHSVIRKTTLSLTM